MPIFLFITHLELDGILYVAIYMVSLMGMGYKQQNGKIVR